MTDRLVERFEANIAVSAEVLEDDAFDELAKRRQSPGER